LFWAAYYFFSDLRNDKYFRKTSFISTLNPFYLKSSNCCNSMNFVWKIYLYCFKKKEHFILLKQIFVWCLLLQITVAMNYRFIKLLSFGSYNQNWQNWSIFCRKQDSGLYIFFISYKSTLNFQIISDLKIHTVQKYIKMTIINFFFENQQSVIYQTEIIINLIQNR
jgi:hypothetical protein